MLCDYNVNAVTIGMLVLALEAKILNALHCPYLSCITNMHNLILFYRSVSGHYVTYKSSSLYTLRDILFEIKFLHTSVGVCWVFFSDFGKSLLPLLFNDSWNKSWIYLIWETITVIQFYVFKCPNLMTKPSQMKVLVQ